MKRAILLVALLAGCDDDSLPAKVANAQLHGIVAARVECDCFTVPESGFNSQHVTYRASKLVDGSCFVGIDAAQFWGRGEAAADTCDTYPGQGGNLFAENGLLQQQSGTPLVVAGTADLTSCCTGFNLEAFGVE